MKYKYFLILFLAVLTGLGHITFSDEEINPSDDSATWWSRSIPEITLVTEFDGIEEELQRLVTAERRFTSMEEALSQSQKTTEDNHSKQEALLRDIQSMQRDIRKNIAQNEEETQQIGKNIGLLQGEIEGVQDRQREIAVFVRKTFVEGYKNTLQTKNNDNTWSLLLSHQSFGNTIAKEETLNVLQNSTENLLDRQKSLQENLETLQKNLENTLLTKKQTLSALAKDREELKQAQEVEQNILSNLSQKEEQIGNNLSKISNQRMSVQAKIIEKKENNAAQFETKFSEYETTLRNRFSGYKCGTVQSPACTWMNQYLSMEKEMLTKDVGTSNFTWPIIPSNGLGYSFRDQKYYVANNTHHEGLDILTPIGFPIQAIADGYILIKQNPSDTSPGVVIVKHPNGYMSVYVGMNPNKKPMFSRVSAGDSLGTTRLYAEPGEENNVHIELYDHGKAIDPLEKLDLSIVQTENIPARYGWKYIDDLKKSKTPFSLTDIQRSIGFFYVDGATEAERQTKFLEKYASSDFSDRSIWVRESLPESIDPTFVMCVGFAESSLGKNLTTNGNIGNVGNTDSGLRRDYNGPESGIRAIATVVNNNWLGGYNTLDQLSGWGNPKGPIYASSRTNWHENLVKCMSAIKQRYVGNSSPFRLSQADFLLYQQQGFSNRKDS